MKNSLTIALFIISSIMYSQSPIETNIGDFKELQVYDLIEVKLVKSTENKIKISGKNTDKVNFINKNGKLKIKMQLDAVYNGKDTKVTLYYTTFDELNAYEGASIHSTDIIKQFEIELNAQTGGKIDVVVETSYANTKSYTGGNVSVSGSSKNQKISITTGGIFDGQKLVTETTEVKIKAGGDARINVTELADVKITAGGTIYVYGNPKEVKESKAMGGTIKRID